MTTPLEAEATGQEFIETSYRGHVFSVRLDVDSWPLAAVRRSFVVTKLAEPPVIVHSAVVIALRLLLGEDQWDAFLEVAPKRKHWVPAANAFAEAVGIPSRGDADRVFGGLPWLLAVLDRWPDKVESDLDQFWGIEYGHRYLFEAGRRRLTLRKIYTRLSNLPVDSALAIAMNDGKLHRTGAELVLMDLFQYGVGTGRPHPSRPKSAEQRAAESAEAAQEEQARAQHRERQEKRQNRQKAGVENARANARREQQQRDAHAQEN